MSQSTDAEAIMKDLHAQTAALKTETIQGNLARLDALLEASQASPPDGKADGTISPARWTSLTACSMAYKRFLSTLALLK